MRCVLSKLAAGGRITVEQFATARKWAALSGAYRRLVSGSYADGWDNDAGNARRLSTARLDAFERVVIRRYRLLAPYLGPLERAVIEGQGRYPRTLGELCAVRRALDEIGARWNEAG
jgi:hypothetical protein